jgi:integrase
MAGNRKYFSDRSLKALAPAKPGERYEIWDERVSGFGVRVGDARGPNGKAAQITFVLYARFGSRSPSRRRLGVYGQISLEQARAKAAEWRELINKGIDPAIEFEKQKAAALRERSVTFEKVAEDFVRDKLSKERRGWDVESNIRKHFIPAWGKRPVSDITLLDVRAIVTGFKDRGKVAMAHNALGNCRRLFSWALEQHCYGLESSTCERLKPRSIIGKRAIRDRVLTDDEMRAVWLAADKIGYPYGSMVRMLMLTGVRLSEAAEAQWAEIDLSKLVWTIPSERQKANRAHVVPLSHDAVRLIESLPRRGNYLISATGKNPVSGFSVAKARLDVQVAELLGKTPSPWRFHDIRRTVRTHLSALPAVSDLVRELVIGHSKPGLHKVYDQHAYLDEKRHALELWAQRLRNIVEPPPPNVIELTKGRR